MIQNMPPPNVKQRWNLQNQRDSHLLWGIYENRLILHEDSREIIAILTSEESVLLKNFFDEYNPGACVNINKKINFLLAMQ
jgi:hypothetical protein